MEETNQQYEKGFGVWTFEGSEVDWIAARTLDEALEFYNKHIKPDPATFWVCQVWNLDTRELPDYDIIIGRDKKNFPIFKKVSCRELIGRQKNFPAFISTTVH